MTNPIDLYVKRTGNLLRQVIPIFQSEGWFGIADQCQDLVKQREELVELLDLDKVLNPKGGTYQDARKYLGAVSHLEDLGFIYSEDRALWTPRAVVGGCDHGNTDKPGS